jgi:hypothetical protein
MKYGMLTQDGDAAVDSIVNYYADEAQDHNHLYDLVVGDLERLHAIKAFAEACDTEVREAVYQQCLRLFPMPVFRTVRNKTVDTTA